ncbi:MAG: type II secretion system F family protein, partial [Acidimicrobiia bacterium]|nr:type II secretion system F family protein [Acidimicrobiia bacterium]
MSGHLMLVMAAAAASAIAVGAAAALIVRPLPRMASRLANYTVRQRMVLRPAALVDRRVTTASGAVRAVVGRPLARLVRRLGSVVDRRRPEILSLELRRSGMFPGRTDPDRVFEYRSRLVAATALGSTVGGFVGLALAASPWAVLLTGFLGGIAGAGRWRGRVERATERRRRAMQIELYTVNQLLALRVRSGGGVASAMREMVQRGRGEIVAEFREILALHQAGIAFSEVLRRYARITPEPQVARTYAVLANAEERGADLAAALLAIGDDLRTARRESVRRAATRRRFLMLAPVILFLAPVMILFVIIITILGASG